MDHYIAKGVEYKEWEDHYFSMEEKCEDRFEKWLNIKGVRKYSENFSFHIKVRLFHVISRPYFNNF